MRRSRAAYIVARVNCWTQQGRLQRHSLYLYLPPYPLLSHDVNGYYNWTTAMFADRARWSSFTDVRYMPCTGRSQLDPELPSSTKVEGIDKRVNDPGTVGFGDVLVQLRGRQSALRTFDSLDEALHPDLPAVDRYPFDLSTWVSFTHIATFSHSLDPMPAFNRHQQCLLYTSKLTFKITSGISESTPMLPNPSPHYSH
jgi:hypothetical protein